MRNAAVRKTYQAYQVTISDGQTGPTLITKKKILGKLKRVDSANKEKQAKGSKSDLKKQRKKL